MLLLDDGESCTQIAKFLYLDDDTIRGWYEAYRRDGWEVLALDGWQGGHSTRRVDMTFGIDYGDDADERRWGSSPELASADGRVHSDPANHPVGRGAQPRVVNLGDSSVDPPDLPPYCPHLNPIERLWAACTVMYASQKHMVQCG